MYYQRTEYIVIVAIIVPIVVAFVLARANKMQIELED